MSTPETSSDTPVKPSGLPAGSRVVVAVLLFAVLFGVALSLCVRYVVGNMKETVDADREAAKTEPLAEADGKSAKTDSDAPKTKVREP